MNDNELEFFEKKNQREKVILWVLTIYSVGMICVSVILSWPIYITPIVCVGLFLTWTASLSKCKDFHFRINLMVIISLIDFTMYAVRSESLYYILTPLAAVAVLFGITAFPEVMCWVSIDTAFLCFYHIFVLKTVPFSTPLQRCRLILALVSIALVEGVIYWIMKNQHSMLNKMQDIIDDLKSAENSKSDFLANISHEIRTPVNVVCGISESILMEDTSDRVKENVRDIQTAGRNLQRLINDLLDFTELQSGDFSIVEEPYNLTSTINDVLNMTDAQIGTKKIELIVDCDAGIPRSLLGDEQKIRRVMSNILNNAVKFTEDGCIRLYIGYRVESYGINLIVSVQDTGIGIKEENLEKIFTNFSQVDTKRNRQEGGIGLGLAISGALVLKMGGFINVESEWEKGTKVQFVIPQRVLEDSPIIEVKNPSEKRCLCYSNWDKYRYSLTRNSYVEMVKHIGEQLKVTYHLCRNLGELKRRVKKENYTYIVLGWEEYCEDSNYFEEMAKNITVLVTINKSDYDKNRDIIRKSRIIRIMKPFYALSIATALNDSESLIGVDDNIKKVGFVAPEAAVLVVDDSSMNLRVMEGLLHPYQIRVYTAESGAEALEKIERYELDFVFMDHMMPEMDGVETLHRIREKSGEYFKKIPIIALTANAIGGAREMFLEEGFQDFVSKPVEMPVLERVLKKYIPEYKKVIDYESKKKDNAEAMDKTKVTDNDKIKGLNMKLGIHYSGGSKEDYIDIVKIYCSSGRNKIPEIDKFYENEDWNNYTILVHALKSTSLSIGAEELSEKAKQLEIAGNKGDVDYIKKHHNDVMEEYKNMIDMLEERLLNINVRAEASEAVELKKIDKEKLSKMLAELGNALEMFDEDMAKPILEELKKYQYKNKNMADFARSIEESIDVFDFVTAQEKLQLSVTEVG